MDCASALLAWFRARLHAVSISRVTRRAAGVDQTQPVRRASWTEHLG